MQKFREKLKNIPTDTPLVCSFINFQLNKDQGLSVENKVLSLNNHEEDQRQANSQGLRFFFARKSKTLVMG